MRTLNLDYTSIAQAKSQSKINKRKEKKIEENVVY